MSATFWRQHGNRAVEVSFESRNFISRIHVRFLSCLISSIVLPTLPSPSSAVLLKFPIIVVRGQQIELVFLENTPHQFSWSSFELYKATLYCINRIVLYLNSIIYVKYDKIKWPFRKLISTLVKSKLLVLVFHYTAKILVLGPARTRPCLGLTHCWPVACCSAV